MIRMPEQVKIGADLIDKFSRGFQISQVLNTALSFDIFSKLEGQKTVDEISRILETNPFLTKKFLNVLVSLGLLSKIGEKYVKTQLSEIFLVKDSPFYQGNLVNLVIKNYQEWTRLSEFLKDGIKQKSAEASKGAFDKRFILAMAEANLRGPLYRVAGAVSSLTDFKTARKLLDLGGGHGLYAIALTQENPQLKGVVFDLPPVVEVAKEFIKEYQIEDRVGVMAGDYMKDDIGNGYDIIFVSHTFYKPKKAVLPLLKKIHVALNPGGMVILNHWVVNEDGIASETVTLWDLWLSLLGYQPHVYTKQEAKNWLEEAGFAFQEIIDISTTYDPSMLIIGKRR